MIAGRFHWKAVGAGVPGKVGLAAFDLPIKSLLMTEAGSSEQAAQAAAQGRTN